MNAAWWRIIGLVATAAAIAFVGYQYQIPGREDFGIHGPQGAGSGQAVRVAYVDPGSPAARVGIRPGDRIAYPVNAFEKARAVFATPGSRVTLIVNGNRRVTLTARRIHVAGIPWWVTVARLAFLLVAAMLIWRRPADRAVQALSIFLFCYGFGMALDSGILPRPLLSLFIMEIGAPVLFVSGTAAIAIFAALFPSGHAHRLPRLLARAAVAVAALLIAQAFYFILTPDNLPLARYAVPFSGACFAVLAGLVLAIFVVAYRQGAQEERERRRWVSLMLGIAVGALLVDVVVAAFAGGYNPIVDIAVTFPLMLVPIGLAYVILRHRVIDVGFALNKATVYTIVSVIVVGLFVVLETLVSRYVEQNNRITSVAVLLGVSLVIGFSVRYIHDRVDQFVDSVLFRERHAAETAIRAFAHDASYITDRDVLLERTVRTLERYAHAQGAAVWLADARGRYRAVNSSFDGHAAVSENDAAIVAMRARGVAVDLREGESELPGALSFPMIVRGELLGILICGSKPDGESYAPDEQNALASLAASVGHALDTIEVRELRRQVDRLTGGHPAGLPATSGSIREF